MTLLTETGTFTKTTSTSTPVSQTITLANSSLTPKVVWLWTSGQTTSDGTYADQNLWSYGWSDGTNDVCQALRAHETNENEAYVMRNDAVISILSLTADSEVSRATVSSFAAGQVNLSWTVQSDTSAMVIHYSVAGGDDITNVSAFTSTMQNISTGNHSWNGSGTSFTPDFAMTTAMQDVTSVAINTISASADLAQLSIGAATGTSNQWLLAAREETVTTSDVDMYLNDGQCLGSLNPSSGAFAYGGTFVSFNNSAGGGITVNITTAASQSNNSVGFLLIKGGKWDVKAFQQRNGTGTQDVTLTDATVVPSLVQLVGINSATLDTVVAHHYVGIGASDGTNEGNCYNGSTNALGTWETARSTSNTKVYRNATPAATATSSTTNAECDMTDMTTAGQFTLDWTTADATQRQMAFFMIGAVPSGTTFERSPSADSVTVSDSSLTRILSAARAPSADSLTVSEASLTRMTQAFRSPSSDSVTAEDSSTTQIITRVRAPTADSITAEDSSTTQMITRGRVPTAEDVTLDDSGLTRMLQAFRSPSSDSVTVDENLSGGKLLEREPTADSVTVADSSLTRMLSASRQPSEADVTTGENLTRILSAMRSPSSDSVTAEDSSTTQSLTRSRAPTTEDITVSDSSLTRMLSASRAPSDDTITVIDSSLTRIYSALRVPSTEIVDTTEDIDALVTNPGQFNRSPATENVVVDENLARTLQLFRVPSADSITVDENLSGGKLLERIVSADTVDVVEQSLTRIKSLTRNVEDTSNIVEASLTRLLSAIRTISPETVTVDELQTVMASYSRSIEDTIIVTEPTLERLLMAVREATDSVDVADQIFAQTYHKFLFDSVVVAEQLFIELEQLGGSMSYATPAEVRPLLGNLGQQRTDAQITLAIDSAYDEINRKTNRQPPNDWKDTENDFGIVKKICRFKAALEMAIGIKDFEDREWMQKEIDEMFMIIEQHDAGGELSNDMVISSDDETYALNPNGIIWSQRYKNLKKGSSGGTEGSTTIPE